MTQLKFGSAGVTATEIDVSGPVTQTPTGIPAGVIGTANRGPAFVPVTVGVDSDFYAKFGLTDGKKYGPLAAVEWLRNSDSLTYVRVLGVGDGKKRNTDGSVTNAGFVVGENLPRESDGALAANPYANAGTSGASGRAYVLGAFMSESLGSTIFSDAGIQGQGSITPGANTAVPIVRGILMAASGVILRLSSSVDDSAAPSSTLSATNANAKGTLYGAVDLLSNGSAKQEFVLLLNGHKGTDASYPNVITASFDMTSPNYFGNVLNKDSTKLNQAGHFLYTSYDIHPSLAVVTGSGLISASMGVGASTAPRSTGEIAAFITTSSLDRNVGSDTVPNFEAFVDRFSHASSPWVISQKFGGVSTNLFRIHAIDAGANISTQYKLSIENITPSTDLENQYGSFDLIVRDINDNDLNVRALEQWRGLSLDPSSNRYISKVIGDLHAYYDFDINEASQKLVVDGNYENKSNYIRIEVSTDVENQTVDATALPIGVRGILHLVTSGTMPMTSPSHSHLNVSAVLKRTIESPLPLRNNITQGSGVKLAVNPALYWGHRFEHVTSLTTPNASTMQDKTLLNFAKYLPDYSLTNQNVVIGNNEGEPATAANGILDADKFCNNLFTLENLQVVTGSNTLADSKQWAYATYVRNGNITTNDTAKTRRLTIDDFTQANRRFLKFSFIMQGGFNGTNMFDVDESELTNKAVNADMNSVTRDYQNGATVKAYTKAIEVMQNTTNVDIQLLAIPGIRNETATNAAINAVEDRFDALYIMDLEQYDNDNNIVYNDSQLPSVTNTIEAFRNRALDSSFAATYFSDVLLTDPNTKTNLFVPPSVAVLGALSYNDAVAHPWNAPAGTNRGALQTALETRVALNKENLDALYDASINPITSFPGNATVGTNPKGGVVIWGQKTLQVAASALDRVNVRRLMIDIRRQIRDVERSFIFEPALESTLKKFSDAVTPILQRVQSLSGIDAYKVVIDTSTTTEQDIIDNTIRGKIFVAATKTTEFVALDFTVANSIK